MRLLVPENEAPQVRSFFEQRGQHAEDVSDFAASLLESLADQISGETLHDLARQIDPLVRNTPVRFRV